MDSTEIRPLQKTSDEGEMRAGLRKSALSKPRRELLEVIGRYTFCRIENLAVHDGEPIVTDSTRILQEIKIGSQGVRHGDQARDDFLLQAPFIELFDCLQAIANGRVAVLEVRHRLPFRLIIERHTSEGAQ